MDHGFILYPTYTIEEDQPIVQLYGKLENGETFRADIEQTPHFFVAQDDLEAAKNILDLKTEKTTLKTLEGEPVVKVFARSPKDVPQMRQKLQDANIVCYEADIRFAYRYLIDKRITGDCVVKGEYEKGTHVDRVYTNPEILPGNWNGTLKTLSIDIETDKKAGTLWSVSVTDGKTAQSLILQRECDNATRCETEKELLEELNKLIKTYDPDIITGWNVIDFDLKVLKEHYEREGVNWDWARDSKDCSLRIQSDFLRDSSANIPGRQVLDGIHLLKTNFVKLDSYTLESAAQHYLGDGKLFKGKQRYEHIEDAYNNRPQELIEYNRKDAQLVLDILEESGTLTLTIERSRITGMQLDRVRASIASLDMLYLPRLREQGYVAPTAGYQQKTESITGGFVMESQPGIYDYVIVCDFKSLYPSVMRTLNIDPLDYRPKKTIPQSSEEYIRAENGAVFVNGVGILPTLLQDLWDAREAARKQGNELARYAIKILMNSFFGVLASPNCRFFSMDIANAITHTCQHIIKKTAEVVGEQGYEVIYGDTDSIFINLKVDTEEEANARGEKIAKDMNEWLQDYVLERYKTKGFLELEYEKTFIRFLMPRTRGGGASKKRYAGLVRTKDGGQKVEFTGLEFVRRDWTDLAKEFQLGILDRVFRKENPQEFIKTFADDLKNGKHDDLLVYRKALRKKLSDYTKTTPPHVKAARLLDEVTSNIIEYVQTVDGPEPVSKQVHSIDYEHYLEKQLRPIADSILVFYDTNMEDVIKGTEQTGLFDF